MTGPIPEGARVHNAYGSPVRLGTVIVSYPAAVMIRFDDGSVVGYANDLVSVIEDPDVFRVVVDDDGRVTEVGS